jgi:hypothetical protein
LVEARRGRPFQGSDDWWDTTYSCWTDALNESGGLEIDEETLDYYVDRAVALIEN